MSKHRYPAHSLRGDYFRAGGGVIFFGGLVFAGGLDGVVFYILAILTALFALLGWRTWICNATVLTVDKTGIATSGLGYTHLAWQDINQVKLNYFSTRRGRQDGWMELMLTSNGSHIKVDSRIENFHTIAQHVHGTALRRSIELNQVTLANFASLGLVTCDAGWGRPSGWTGQRQSAHATKSTKSDSESQESTNQSSHP